MNEHKALGPASQISFFFPSFFFGDSFPKSRPEPGHSGGREGGALLDLSISYPGCWYRR